MKTKEEIQEKLDEVNADERLGYAPAQVHINAPLALIQLSLETQRDILEWVLDKK
jgi:hypothetical protein